jgi:hypothetical protein
MHRQLSQGSSVPPRWSGQGIAQRVTLAQVARARLAQPGTHAAVVAPMPLAPPTAGMLGG